MTTNSKPAPSPEIAAAVALLEADGYTVVRRRTYENLHQKVRDARHQAEAAERETGVYRRWAEKNADDARAARRRVEDLVAFAYEHGATVDDLIAFNRRLDALEDGSPPARHA